MKRLKNKGFVLVFVIIAVALIGAIMLVLTSGADTMRLQSDTAYLRATERNLAASGLAWARRTVGRLDGRTVGRLIVSPSHPLTVPVRNQTMTLDVTNMGIRGANLTIAVATPIDNEVRVDISTSCTRGRRTQEHTSQYKIAW
jgi:hypothetical protein